MTRSAKLFSRSGISAASVTALLALAACGGGGGGGGGGGFPFLGVAPPPPAAAPPAGQKLEVTVIDGALRNAAVFLDKNNNGLLDSGEPNGRTDEAGKVVLEIDAADAGKYPVVALVGTDAVDADLGPVTTAYVLKAPADKPGLVSPLTTLVHYLSDETGTSSDEAEAILREQLGLSASLFGNYIAGNDVPSGIAAATLVGVSQRIASGLAASIGSEDASGGTVSAGDIAKEVQHTLLDKLTSIRSIYNQAFFQSSCAAGIGSDGCKMAVANLADYYATSSNESQLRPANIGVAVGMSKLVAASPPPAADSGAAAGSLDWFYFSDNTNWSRRLLVSNAEENTPANGATTFRDMRSRNVAGTLASWSFGGDPLREGDLHWNGNAWLACADGAKNSSSLRDAQGRSTSNYCDGLSISKNRRAEIDISGQKLADVVNRIKAYPYTSNGPYGTRYADWGPQASAADISTTLGSAVFPAGSVLRVQNGLDLAAAVAYDVRSSAKVSVYPADIAQGGNNMTGTPACGAPSPPPPAGATSLEMLVERSPGKPCVSAPGTIAGATQTFPSGPVNEWWGNSTLDLGVLGNAPLGTAATITGYYTGNQPMRVSFAGGGSSAVTFYICQQRVINGSLRNCLNVGTGSYKIEQLGDARVMSFSEVPGFGVFLGTERVFIERNGEVWAGYKSKLTGKRQLRLNLEAANALFDAYATQGAVGLTPIVP